MLNIYLYALIAVKGTQKKKKKKKEKRKKVDKIKPETQGTSQNS